MRALLVARIEILGEIDKRGAIRFTVSSETTLRGADGRPFDVLVDNFSRTGFMFISDEEFPAGTLVAVGLGGAGMREAQVIWRDGDRHGCEFLVPLPQSKMQKAFKGRDARVADLEAELRRRMFGEAPADAAPSGPDPVATPDPEETPPPPAGLVARVRAWLARRSRRDETPPL